MQQTHFVQLYLFAIRLSLWPLSARGSKPSAGKTERSGTRGFGGGSPQLPNRAAEVSEVRKIDTSRNAFEDLRACICFQHSGYTARSATLRPALHSTRRCAARSNAQGPALYCIANIAHRSVLAAVSPSQEKPSAAASWGTAQRSTKHCQWSNGSKRFRRCARLHLLSAQRI